LKVKIVLGTLALAALAFLVTRPASGQALGVLRIKVVLADADGTATPVPRHALLISDNPPTAAPRRVITALDGTSDVRLRPGNYTVESDVPVAFRGRGYQWMQMVDIVAGRDTVLELTAANAELTDAARAATPSGAAPESDPRILLQQWRDSVVAIWSPRAHASGFVFDARGLIATNQRGIGTATAVEVQLTRAIKVAARVLAADAERDVAVLWIDPAVLAAVKPVPIPCTPAGKPPADGDDVFTLGIPPSGEMDMASGSVRGVEPRAIAVDFVLPPGSAGGPVFTAGSAVVGLTSFVTGSDERSREDARVVRIDEACAVIASAEKAMTAGPPPSATRLPVEPTRPFPVDALKQAVERRAGSMRPYEMSSADFDIAFLTPVAVYGEFHVPRASQRTTSKDTRSANAEVGLMRPPMDFGPWSDYVSVVPPVLLVRVTPRFVEGFWTKVGRAAAQTQGVALPAFKRFKSGFARMRTLCGADEVTPIHPFEIEHRVSEKETIDEGLYVFDPGALGPHCGTVTFVLYSAKEPEKGDTRVVDPKLVEQIWRDFEPFRNAKPADPPRR
jgi:S1-C subfamily serine protease